MLRSRTAALLSILAACCAALPAAASPAQPDLRCRADGSFKILLLADLHHRPAPHPHTDALVSRLLELEAPDLVIVNGDCISGNDCHTVAEVEAAVANVAAPMERAGIAWAVTLGNHDGETEPHSGVDRVQLMRFFASHPHNRNAGWVRGITGVGNTCLLLRDASGGEPVRVIWLLDSRAQPVDPKDQYDWIRSDQIAWYQQTSKMLEQAHGRKIPGLMFFHIPLPEFVEMINHSKVQGERREPECPSLVNSGMFAAVLDRGDVAGIFCGHDHLNNYVGTWKGIQLGYAGVTGLQCYPRMDPDDPRQDRARSARVFLLNAANPETYQTYIRYKDGSTNWDGWGM